MSDSINSTNPGTSGPPQSPSPANVDVAETWRQCEARLQLLRSELEQSAASNAPSQPANVPDGAKLQQVIDILTALAKDPFALSEHGVQGAQKEAEREPNPVSASSAPSPKPEGTPEPDAVAASAGTGTTHVDPAQTGTVSAAEMDDMNADVDGSSEDVRAPMPVPTPAPNDAPTLSTPEPDAFDSQAQASSERLRAALEQNTQLTAAVFDQMLALIAGQNQKLGEVDRRMAELAGQLESIKNP